MKEFKRVTITVGEGLGKTDYIFTKWEKYGKARVYVSYRGKRECGYIDLNNGSDHTDNNEFVKEAVKKFRREYMG